MGNAMDDGLSKIDLTDRLRREGRWAEASLFKDKARRRLKDQGLKRAEAVAQSWVEMAKAFPPLPEVDEEAERKLVEQLEEQEDREFNEAASQLPDRDCPDEDLDWIRSHVAMTRRYQHGIDHVRLDPDDLLTLNGPAPSRAAAFALQHWVNDTDRFYSLMMKRDMKELAAQRRSQGQINDDDYDVWTPPTSRARSDRTV